MSDLLRLVRAHNLVVAGAGVFAGGWIAHGRLAVPASLLWAALSGMGLGMAGNVLNDIWDAPGDRTNVRTDRPLATGRVSRGVADLCVLWGTGVGLAGAALVDGTLALFALTALVLMALYSPVLKRRGLPGNVTVALVAGFPLAYGAIAVGHGPAGIVPWVLAAWLHLGREVTKDLVDVAGDRAMGRRTIPVAWGQSRARALARTTLWAFVPASAVLPALVGFGTWYFVVAALADLLVVAAALAIAAGRLDRAIRQLKYAMPFGVAALVLGRVV